MPDHYTVKITSQAQEHLRGIINCIRYTLQSSETAADMLELLEKEISSLAQLPNRIPLTDEEPWHSQWIHKFPVKNYLVYFVINETENVVYVIGVIYGRRDQRHQLAALEKF